MKDFSQILAKRTLIASMLLLSISVSSQLRNDLKFENRKEVIKVLALEQASTYQKSFQLQSGLEYEILQKFADDFGYQLDVTSTKSSKELFSLLKTDKFDLSMGRYNSENLKSLLPGSSGNSYPWEESDSYDADHQAIICKDDFDLNKAENWTLLAPKTQVFKASTLSLRSQFKKIKVQFSGSMNSQRLFQEFVQGHHDCLLSFQNEARFFKKTFPHLEIVKEFGSEIPFVFLISTKNEKLKDDFNKWISLSAKRSLADHFKRQMAGRHLPLGESDYFAFAEARSEILPQLKDQFVKFSKQFFLPWELMAAVAYQESHWDNDARSFTGVRGIMQITTETAEFLGLEDRLNVEKSIEAASKYIRLLYDRTPKYLAGKDRIALALATYNIGPAHMIDAQNLAIRLGKNPYSWSDLKNILPLLSSDEFSQHFKYGKARGDEPVQFVNYVFNYFEILKSSI